MDQSHYRLGKEFWIAEKTHDVFRDVTFIYGEEIWQGILPKVLLKQGLDLTEDEWLKSLDEAYDLLNPVNRKKWITATDNEFTPEYKKTETYKVLRALYSGTWTCRTHGPLMTNSQPAARVRDIKKLGFIVGSKRKECPVCSGKPMHDILVMLPKVVYRFQHGNELRKPISEPLKKRVKEHFKSTDACFNMQRTSVELLLDHKFPSQRWEVAESDNPNNMSIQNIGSKFQLLTNQTNMMKSRNCDRCVSEGIRGEFFGLRWYYSGNENWAGTSKSDENGCIGCPWYDLVEWKKQLSIKLSNDAV